MKYGDTLRQRSIPQWGHYNIDYDFLKDQIKSHTTPGNGRALSIPGQGATTERAFSDTFFKILKAQHDRINLFIKSKRGEVERRLDFIGKQLHQLQTRRPSAGPESLLPARSIEKYAKVDEDVTKAGEEIRSLSRFRITQQTGFYKILKKYKRWTKDQELGQRFREEVTSNPESFFQLDLGYLLDQYIDVLGAVRAPLSNAGVSSPYGDPSHSSSASRLARITDQGSDIDFDVALTTTPLGAQGHRATYWIHPDHIVEVEVLLLQYMRLHLQNSKTSSPKETPLGTPSRRKSSATAERYFGNEDDVGLIVMDHPESFAQKQNAKTIVTSEGTAGALPSKAAGIARWASGNATIIVGLNSNHTNQVGERVRTAKVKRKNLEAFLETPAQSEDVTSPASSQATIRVSETPLEASTIVQKWLTEHSEVKPIAGVGSKRTRFVGLHNSLVGGMWASLDRDIFMTSSLHKSFANSELLSETRASSTLFPHAILEIRGEGNQPAGLIHTLDRSHLVERVRGFSLETHSVWTCCKPDNMSQPFWVPLLNTDIRKLPAPVKRKRRNVPNTTESGSYITPPQTATTSPSSDSPQASRNGETSATSVSDFVDPPQLRAFRNKIRKSSTEYPPTTPIAPPRTQGYWNEYDNPESDDEGYYIYVDPNTSVKFPGQQMLMDWISKTRNFLGGGKAEEESPLLSAAEEGSSDDETADEAAIGISKSYGTIPTDPYARPQNDGYFSSVFRSMRDPHRDSQSLDAMRRSSRRERRSLLTEIGLRQHERDVAKFQLYSSCLAAGVVLDVTLSILMATSRKKLRGEVDSAIILGVICNLLLLLVAVTSMKSRRERLGWFHQAIVFVLVLAMVVVDALLFRWALGL